jgi:cyclic pyranopterin phosphate synthase
MHDLRISVTDRCNLRCTYCMPEEHFGEKYEFLQRSDLLSFEEIALVARAAAALGVKKLRLTGGEPLLRRDLPVLVGMLREIPGIEDIALTTNGLLLPQLARPLKDAGVDRITVSLDSLDDATLARISGRPITSAQVLAGIDAARAAGFARLKVNAVIQRGVNDNQVLPLAEHFRDTGVILRFIEFMDVGTLNGWNLAAVVPAAEMRNAIAARYPLEATAANYVGEVAARYRYVDGRGEVGFITSVTQPFCRDCSRLRLAPYGDVYTCLFAGHGHPLKPLLRAGASQKAVTEHLRGIWAQRSDHYSEIRTETTAKADKVEMYHIGG